MEIARSIDGSLNILLWVLNEISPNSVMAVVEESSYEMKRMGQFALLIKVYAFSDISVFYGI